MNRWTDILKVLSKYGLADWINQLNLDFAKGVLKAHDGELLAKYSREARIRMALAELGPTFIKLGQILSTRADVVGVALANELKKLQADVPADSPESVRKVVELELCQPIEELFSEFDDVAFASASIGQVHKARMFTGESVVVKVQHIDIESKVNEDLEILAGIASLAERIPEFANYRPTATVGEFQRALRRELDYGREERNLLQFASQFEKNNTVHIPIVYSELCTSRILTMEYVDGIKLSETEKLIESGIDLAEVARRGAELYVKMIFNSGFYHADPHPGNILVLPGDVIGLLDFGMVGRIDERLREEIEDLMVGITSGDADLLTSVLMRIGSMPADFNENELRRDVGDFISDYSNQSLEDLNFTDVINDMFEIIRRYSIMLPPQVAMLLKTMVMLDGTSRELCPDFSLVELFKNYRSKIILRRLSPARRMKKLWKMYGEVERLVEILPRRLTDILEQVRTGKFDIHLDHRRLGPSVNRMVMGMMTSALFLGSSLLLSRNVPPVIFQEEFVLGMKDVSILGITGSLVSIGLGFRLMFAINKSGNLDKPD
ncbi:MAG: ABC transporter [Blastopirellula sp.]|nr:MAG: ABC transporter [Blastopirellula sp.]